MCKLHFGGPRAVSPKNHESPPAQNSRDFVKRFIFVGEFVKFFMANSF